jgi:hypothetical protein
MDVSHRNIHENIEVVCVQMAWPKTSMVENYI